MRLGPGELGRGSDRPDRELAGVVSREIRGLMPPLTAPLSSSLSSFSTESRFIDPGFVLMCSNFAIFAVCHCNNFAHHSLARTNEFVEMNLI